MSPTEQIRSRTAALDADPSAALGLVDEDAEAPRPLVKDPLALAQALEALGFAQASEEDEPPADWREDGSCAQVDPELFYPEKNVSPKTAKKVCAACPVKDLCLEWALENDERYGVWGGTTENERKQLRKDRKESDAIAAAQLAHESAEAEAPSIEPDPMQPLIDTSSFLRLLAED